MLRFLTAGESHGPGLTAIVEGVPAGLIVTRDGIAAELARRRAGHGRGARMKIEQDVVEILGGVRFGRSLGGPISVLVRNTEWEKWSAIMDPDPAAPDAKAPKSEKNPRPGHADLVGMQKYDTHDARDILERASARETAARTIVGHIAKQLLETIDVHILSHVTAIGSVSIDPDAPLPTADDAERIEASEVRAHDPGLGERMVDEIDRAAAEKDTLGGSAEVLAFGLPPGIGSHVHWDRKLDGLLAGALMSIQAIKAVEIGDGIAQSRSRGTAAHDEITHDGSSFKRRSNHAGGLEGGMTTGEPLRITAYMKPISTVMKPLDTVDVTTKQPTKAMRERSDVCAVPAAGVVAEQMVAYVLANECLRKFGGDTVDDFAGAAAAYRSRLESF